MTKIKLNNYIDFEKLKIELNEDAGAELSFQNEESPTSYPCIAVNYYTDDTDFGSLYSIEFVYPSDFN
jgi:hypothetical protein